jgi:hypothetical protein
MKTQIFILLFALASFIYSGCDKDDLDTDTKSAQDFSRADMVFSKIFQDVHDRATHEPGINRWGNGNLSLSNCPVITTDTISNPKTMVIDYGPDECWGSDNISRKGKIIATFSGNYSDSGSVVTVTFEDFYIYTADKVNATVIIRNLGMNTQGSKVYSIEINNASINHNGSEIRFTSNRAIHWVSGHATQQSSDDIYMLYGNGNGVTTDGNGFTFVIASPIRIEGSCQWPVSGIFELTPNGKEKRVLDFGDGTCDNKVKVTIGKQSAEISL